jgi:branched-chain amino acid transport system substrate-binding protein
MQATLLAIDEINAAGGVLNLPIAPVLYDPESNPKLFRTLAERLMGTDRVRLVFGCYMSSSRKAVLPVIESYRGLLFYPTLYEGFEYSRHCIYTGAAPNQNSVQLARFLFEHYGSRFLLVGSNYVYPYESNRVMTDLVRQNRGSIVNELYVPLAARPADFSRAIADIKKLKPDVIFSTVVGKATAAFYQAYRAAGFDPARQPIASLTTSEAEVAEMSAEAAEGHITAAPFFETLGTATARRFVMAYKARFGADAPVPAAAEAAYFQMHLAATAIARAGSDDPKRIVPELAEIEFAAPQGRVRIDRETNHTYLWPRVARLDARGHFHIVWNPGVRVRPDPYSVLQSLGDWSAEGVAGSMASLSEGG